MEDKIASPQLPGFRFRPTDEELLNCYLRSVVSGKKQQQFDVIGFLNIYGHDPRDLPGLAKIGEREWYFFVPRDRKPTNGWRASRTTQHGFWKATGSDHNVYGLSDPKRVIGYRKTLVFYEGRAPRGTKTDWVMQEYRLKDNSGLPKHQDMIVLCKVYKKATSLKVLEQMAASEEEYHKQQQPQGKVAAFQEPTTSSSQASPPLSSSSSDPATINATASTVIITCPPKEEVIEHTDQQHHIYHKTEDDNNNTTDQLKTWSRTSSTSLLLPHGSTTGLQELQVPNLGWGDHDLYENSYQQSPFFDILTTLFTPSPNCSLLNI